MANFHQVEIRHRNSRWAMYQLPVSADRSGMLESLGLGGDGDEVDAITRVEQAMGVFFPIEDAEQWVTVGDVFRSVLKQLPASDRQPDLLWPTFAAAIAQETGVDPTRVGTETRLLALTIDEHLERLNASIRRYLRNTFFR